MDNKKWYSRFGTIFWWGLTILPLIVVLVQFIGYHLTFNSGITSASELSQYHSNLVGDFLHILDYYFSSGQFDTFESWSLPFLNITFVNLFDILFSGEGNYVILGLLFGWMTSVQFYHLIFDFMVWLPRWCHNILEKGVGKVD